MSRFAIIQVSKDDKFSMTLSELSDNNITVYQDGNNSASLGTIYNSYLHIFRTEKDIDFAIFMHSDVKFDLQHLLAHIEECKDKYDVMGLCGTSTLNVSQSPLNWFTGSNPTPNTRYGHVTHGELGNLHSDFGAHSPNTTDHEVACIDGVCIIFGPKALKSELKFDEQFMFDFYDTDISLQTVMKYGMKLGVIVEPSLQHYSAGKSILTTNFLMSEIKFRQKWNFEIPINSSIHKLFKTLT